MTIDVFLASMAAIGLAALMIYLLTRKGDPFGSGRQESVRSQGRRPGDNRRR